MHENLQNNAFYNYFLYLCTHKSDNNGRQENVGIIMMIDITTGAKRILFAPDFLLIRLLILFYFLVCNFLAVYLAPSVDNVGKDERNEETDNCHCTEGELTAATVG